jgi:glycosyltransferase involved in cell wall biosynthesis
MKILILHNYYQQPGGEDLVVQQEQALLEAKGHTVALLAANNRSITGIMKRAAIALGTVYSPYSRVKVEKEIGSFEPDLVHVHNFFPQLSPSVYYACRTAKLPVVQTLHNFRLICLNALLFRDGKPCELCVGRSVAWPGITHACYRESYSGSAVLGAMLATHRVWGTWRMAVDAYVTLSNFARRKLVAGGVPSSRLFVKPNCLMPDPGVRKASGNFALFVGRLSPEKGIKTLLAAWRHFRGRELKVVGDGPLRDAVEESDDPNVEFLGRQSAEVVLELMGAAAFLIFPSECYENFPRVIVEAFAKGVPVLGSRLGSAEELIEDGRTGVLFNPGDAQDLASKAEWLFAHPDELTRMSGAARMEFERKYTADRNYEQLMKIYRSAMEVSSQRFATSKRSS